MLVARACLLFLAPILALAATDDATTLVQQRMQTGDPSLSMIDPSLSMVAPSANNNTLVAASTAPAFLQYRVVIESTHGADHVCMTELEFFDAFRKPLTARFMYMSSCYGCPIACDDCKADWGNPFAQFDLVTSSEANEAWSCTAPGSFPGGVGHQEIAFTLPSRPAKGLFHSPTLGNWLPKDFKLQEQQPDRSWKTIALVSDTEQDREVPFYIQWVGSLEEPILWPVDFAQCGALTEPQPVDVVADIDPPSLSFSSTPLENRMLAANGMPGVSFGMAIDGDVGTINVAGGTFEIRQLNLVFPSNRRIVSSFDGPHSVAEGELHIIAQRSGSTGVFDPAVIVIPLELPQEGSALSASEMFFRNLGLTELPRKGEPKSLVGPVDLSIFAPNFAGGVQSLRCSDHVPWYVLTTPAYVSGDVVYAFKNGPPELPEVTENETIYNTAGYALDGSSQAGVAAGPTPQAAYGAIDLAPGVAAGPSPQAAMYSPQVAGPVPPTGYSPQVAGPVPPTNVVSIPAELARPLQQAATGIFLKKSHSETKDRAATACGYCRGCLTESGCRNLAEHKTANREICNAHGGKWCSGLSTPSTVQDAINMGIDEALDRMID